MKTKRIVGILGIAFAGSLLGVLVYSLAVKPEIKYVQQKEEPSVRFAGLPTGGMESADFRLAADQSVHAVVHVTSTKFMERYRYGNLFDYFFNEPSGTEKIPNTGYGSGVIISADGYIVTNNHVVGDADEVKIKMNEGRELDAELIGADPNTDVAVIKVKGKDLPYLNFGNSDQLMVGDWVLAVGNPWNLYSTVTAGIVSAKARDINIIGNEYTRDRYGRVYRARNPNAVESFIQTDAAVNQGNSGGALVNLKGELVGINTAIASQTGAYAGYSFAIPSVIVERVVTDLIEFGKVKRAALGVSIATVDSKLPEFDKLDVTSGVYISDVTVDGAATEAGLKKGDVILAVNGYEVKTASQLQEQIMKYRAGEKVNLKVDRKGNVKNYEVKLKDHEGNAMMASSSEFWSWLGADLKALEEADLERMDIPNGVRVENLKDGVLKSKGVPEGFVITDINKRPVNSAEEVKRAIESIDEGVVLIEGLKKSGEYEYYTFRK